MGTGFRFKVFNNNSKVKEIGAKILVHKASNLKDVDVVVVSSAISFENIELKVARRNGLPVVRRADACRINEI